MIDHSDPALRYFYIFLAALAGGVTALAFMKYRLMTRAEIALTVFVGTTFSLFCIPYLATVWFGIDETDAKGVVFFSYIGAAGAYTFIPWIIRKFTKGDPA